MQNNKNKLKDSSHFSSPDKKRGKFKKQESNYLYNYLQ